ncbi:ABC transporter ATP-binding protein [Rhizobium sp. Root149]|uniref:ABC transporter ATP-binding protein n=1 Tax=Rhizobium sp. Root149 TaxID=1736473 RepID=UPI000AE0E189|nr:ABC transporter ATP-binding protein [Rhizobium sp. Root149]
MSFLKVNGLDASYGKIAAIRDISIEIEAGTIVTIIGPNGAGKSTFLKALMGLMPYKGHASFEGAELGRHEVQARVGKGIILVPETRELFSEMTVRDNLTLGSYSRRFQSRASIREDFDKVYSLFPRLAERAGQEAGTLSGGERQMLALGRALMARPKLLMLDEPSLGLAPIIVREIFQIIANLRSMNVGVLLVEQNARAALQTADFGYVLETGEIVMSGPAPDLLNHPRVMQTYLGGSTI